MILSKEPPTGSHPIFISIAVLTVSAAVILGYSAVKNANLFSPSTSQLRSGNYKYDLAEFIQKQQTTSPYTKYEPSLEVDLQRGKIYYVYKVMDDGGIWQIWTATSNLGGGGWKEVQQTNSSENKQRVSMIYDTKGDNIYYFYRTGADRGAANRTSSKLMVATKKPAEEKWRNERQLLGENQIDDLSSLTFDPLKNRIIFAYTKNSQITTASLDLNTFKFSEKVHTSGSLNSYIPNMKYDPNSDTAYIVFPRGRTPGMNQDKDLWLAKVGGNGDDYVEIRLTNTDYENTWPFVALDVARNRLYVKYGTISEPTTYSKEGVANVKERNSLGMADLDGKNWKVLRQKDSFDILGVNSKSGAVYGLYQTPYKEMRNTEGNDRYFVVYDANKNELKKQAIPSGDKNTYYDAAEFDFDAWSNRIFGVQQVCASAGDRAIECQIWTYTGKILDNSKSSLAPQQEARMLKPQEKKLPDLKLTGAQALSNKIKINTNRKLSMPPEMKVTGTGGEIIIPNSGLQQIDQDRGFEWRFVQILSAYKASYKVCALSDPKKPMCIEGNLEFP